jgi:hypothetical protein
MNTSTQILFAMNAQSKGWSIFPCEPGDKRGAFIKPTTWRLRWYDEATNDILQIAKWWGENRDYNIGISAKKSNLLIIDCDVPKEADATTDGWDQFKALCERRGVSWEDTIDTYQVETPSLGVHLYYQWPAELQASQAKLDTYLDVRSNGGEKGGYVVGAGSYIHNEDDHTRSGWYHVINPADVAECPPWLREEVTAKRHIISNKELFTGPHAVSDTGLHNFARMASEGSRNDSLFWAVAKKAEEDPEADVESLFELFVEDAEHVGLTPQEIRATVRSAYNKVRNGT